MRFQTMLPVVLLVAMPPSLAMTQQVEPGVQTSSAATPVPPAGAVSNAGSQTSPSADKPGVADEASAPKASAPKAKASASNVKASAPAAKAAAHTPDKPGTRSSDHIQLDTTQISGNQELPKFMYVVPWRRADPGEFAGRPPNSLLDEALTPVDRDVFRRQNRYYGVLQAQSQAAAADSTGKDEK